jgi:DNA excision repair protein ERCC-6
VKIYRTIIKVYYYCFYYKNYYCKRVGGIIGDEMGLGKTIEVIAFLAALKYSKIGRKWPRHPHKGFNLVLNIIINFIDYHYLHSLFHIFMTLKALLVCPATIMTQWVKEFHKWWPPFRVVLFHSIG